jgi:hypothetical protein
MVPRMTKLGPAPQQSAMPPIAGGMMIGANRFEGIGFEPSVPRDTAEVSRAAHIASA